MAGVARLVSLALTVAVAVSLAQTVWLFVPDGGSKMGDMEIPQRGGPARMVRTAGLDQLIALDLFGRAPVAAVVEVPQDAPDTSLALTLRGLFAVTPKDNAWAIIASSGGVERHYRTGDRVAGAVVRDILPDRVILEHGGRFETLRLPREGLNAGQVQRERETSVSRAPAGGAGQLRELRDTLAANPQEIARIVDITPVMEGGDLRGYNVSPRRHRDLFRQAGLRPNDVVVGVNGIPVTDMARMGDLMVQLQTADRLTLAIERSGGESLSIDIDMN